MAFHPISTRAERDGNTVRLYASPRFLPSRGASIYQAVKITRHWKSGQWIVSLDGPATAPSAAASQSVTIAATNGDYPAAIVSAPKVPNVFGDIIDPTKISGNMLTFQVTAGSTSPGRVPTRDAGGHWHFGAVDGVDLGVFFHKWLAVFGSRCRFIGNTITIDITPEKAAGKPINLDPEVVPGSQERSWLSGNGMDWDWATARAGGASGLDPAGLLYLDWNNCQALIDTPGSRRCCRGLLRFDTSGYPSVSSAVLNYPALEYTDAVDLEVRAVSLLADLTDYHNWPLLAAGSHVGTIAAGNDGAGTMDVTGAYRSTAAFDFSALTGFDESASDDPGSDYKRGWDMTGGSPPTPSDFYLELTLAAPPSGPPAGSLMMMGVGR